MAYQLSHGRLSGAWWAREKDVVTSAKIPERILSNVSEALRQL